MFGYVFILTDHHPRSPFVITHKVVSIRIKVINQLKFRQILFKAQGLTKCQAL